MSEYFRNKNWNSETCKLGHPSYSPPSACNKFMPLIKTRNIHVFCKYLSFNDDYRFSLSSEFFFNSSSRLRLFEPFLLDFSGFKETPACGVRVIGCANIEKCHPIHYLKQAPEKVPSGCLVWGMGICPLVGPTQAPPSCRCTSRLATSTLFAQCH